MEKLMKKVHQYRMEHGYPEDEEELLKVALYFYIMGQRGRHNRVNNEKEK